MQQKRTEFINTKIILREADEDTSVAALAKVVVYQSIIHLFIYEQMK